FCASLRAEAVVTRRQLFPPNPSVKPSLIFFGPHQDGVADGFADDVAAATMTAVHASASVSSAPPLFLLIRFVSLLSFVVIGPRPAWAERGLRGRDARHTTPRETACERSPVDGVEGNAHCERCRLDEGAR